MSECANSVVGTEELASVAALLMESRHTVLPKRLIEPGPNKAQVEMIFQSASTAPDHGQLHPWRFIVVPATERQNLAEAFASALIERDSSANDEEVSRAREKAYRAPLLVLLVVDAQSGDQSINLNERLISAGCALQNMLLIATAQGYGSALTSGKAMESHSLRSLFELTEHEVAVCFMSIGTAQSRKMTGNRLGVVDFVTTLHHSDQKSAEN